MRTFRAAAVLALAVVFRITYGNESLGTWTQVDRTVSPIGTYDGSVLDPTNGSGYPTVTLTRIYAAGDQNALWPSLQGRNDKLTIVKVENGVVKSNTTCSKAQATDFTTSGSGRSGTETLAFACTTVR